MFVVDANVLLYAVNRSTPQHRDALSWLDDALSGQEPVGFAWVALLAFLRISTRAGVLPRPLDVEDGLAVIGAWLGAAPATVVAPTARHLAILGGLLTERGIGGNLSTDAHLAALAIEHGATMVSFDRDFGRFAGLRSLVPGP